MDTARDFPATPPHKALFLDRDGVVIDYIPYLSKPEQVNVPSGAGKALKQWQKAGYRLIIITNQSGVGRGYFSLDDVHAIHQRLCDAYQADGVKFDDILICPHHPDDDCGCRKPSPAMLLKAAKNYNIDLNQSFFMGDAPSDLDCAIQAGCQPVLLLTGRGKQTAEKLAQYSIKIPIFERLSQTVSLIQ